MNVNKHDFFLYVFAELIDPKSDMFMYNDNQTLAWFPPKVKNLFDGNRISRNLLTGLTQNVSTAQKRRAGLLSDWRAVWTGALPSEHGPPPVPPGPLQEAAESQTLPGGLKRVWPCSGRVRFGNTQL